MELRFGEIYRRKELHDHFGGNRRSGISAPAQSKVVFLIIVLEVMKTGMKMDGWKIRKII